VNGYEVYKTYLAIKLHFTTDDYDFNKYQGKVNAKLDSFTKRKDKYFFHKLSTRFNDTEIVHYFVSNFLDNKNKWIGDVVRNKGDEVYLNYKKRIDSITYTFENDMATLLNNFTKDEFENIFKINKGQHPILLKEYLGARISLETMTILDKLLNYVKQFDKNIEEKFVWPEVSRRIKKYRSFLLFNETKMKTILKDKIK